MAVTGYPAGGVAPLGLPSSLPVVVDAATAALTTAFGGGGLEHLLLRVQISDVIRCNNALVADITEHPEPASP
jgi:prolyl-tRNA editing enzyme YbaK/EbsC (Cys-tRNA(Pro) deacylase)